MWLQGTAAQGCTTHNTHALYSVMHACVHMHCLGGLHTPDLLSLLSPSTPSSTPTPQTHTLMGK